MTIRNHNDTNSINDYANKRFSCFFKKICNDDCDCNRTFLASTAELNLIANLIGIAEHDIQTVVGAAKTTDNDAIVIELDLYTLALVNFFLWATKWNNMRKRYFFFFTLILPNSFESLRYFQKCLFLQKSQQQRSSQSRFFFCKFSKGFFFNTNKRVVWFQHVAKQAPFFFWFCFPIMLI